MAEEQCAFCPKPERRTTWWHEDEVCLIINKPDGEPMVVLKEHTTTPSTDQMFHIRRVCKDLFGSYEFRKLMHHVPNHFHLHIVNYDHMPEESL